MSPAGIGAGGVVTIVPEVTMGTFLDPTTAGNIQVPILSETLAYTENKYYSQQIRQKVIDPAVKAGPYHVEGDIVMEFDSMIVPYFLYATRHTIAKSGAGPYVYKFTPNSVGAAAIASSMKTLSITVERNGVGFGYFGCVMSGFEFTINDGVLQFTAHIMGMGEQTPGALSTPSFVSPKIMGADSMNVFTGAAATSPTFAQDLNFNGYTFSVNHNADPQNRIRNNRIANYIAYGKTDLEVTTELDFTSKTEYSNMLANTAKAIRLEAIGDALAYSSSTDAVHIDVNNSVYDSYEIGLSGIGDLIMANATFHGLNIAGGDAYAVEVRSQQNIT